MIGQENHRSGECDDFYGEWKWIYIHIVITAPQVLDTSKGIFSYRPTTRFWRVGVCLWQTRRYSCRHLRKYVIVPVSELGKPSQLLKIGSGCESWSLCWRAEEQEKKRMNAKARAQRLPYPVTGVIHFESFNAQHQGSRKASPLLSNL